MSDDSTRRSFLTHSAALAAGVALGACSAGAPGRGDAKLGGLLKSVRTSGSLDDDTLRWMAQLGLEWVCLQGTDWVDREGKGYWSPEDIELLQQKCRAFELELYSLMIPHDWLMSPMLEQARQRRAGRGTSAAASARPAARECR